MVTLLVGLDWADEKHDVCIRDEFGATLTELTIAHSREGLELLRDQVRAASRGQETEVLCAIETNQGLLVNFLLEQGWTVYALNPKAVDRYRDRLRNARAKSDRLDAWLLADILRTDRQLHRPIQPDSELVRELRELTRSREDLGQESVRLINQLQACLKTYWPESLGFFSELDRPIALDFLARYPTWKQAHKASLKVLQAYFKTHHHPRWEQKAQAIYEALRAPRIDAPAYLVRPRSRQMLHLVRQLQTVTADLKTFDKEIERLLGMHPDGQLFLSLPGAGANLAARMLAEIGDSRERYATANSLQCDAGTAPVTKKSGKSLSVVLFRRTCKKQLRHALHLFAGSSLQYCPWARTLYEEQRAKGKRYAEAVRTVANRWVKIIFGMRRSGSCYDERRYLAAKERFLEGSQVA